MMNSLNSSWLNPVMVFFSSQIIWLPFIAFFIMMAFKKIERKSFYVFILFLALALVASDVSSSYLLKNIFQRLRPCRVEEIKSLIHNFGQKCGGRFGFVSSHAANSVCILVFSFLSLKIKSSKLYLVWLLPLMVGYSRIYLGVHYPGDVVGGMIVGIFWGFIFAMFFKSYQSWSEST